MESGEGEEVNIEELVANLSTYKDQLQQVRKLLNDDPKNSEFLDMEKELVERNVRICENGSLGVCQGAITSILVPLQVIQLTEELLATAKQSDSGSGLGTGTSGEASPSPHLSGSSFHKSRAADDDGDKFSVGTKVQAVWSEDGEWYDATIEAHTPNGYYVSYDEWGNKEEVDPDNVRAIQEGTADPLLEAEKIAVATKEALKRKIAQAASKDFQPWTVPQKLQIDPNDPEDVKAAKRKKIHAFKSKMRMEAKEVTQNKRQNAWQQFQTTKGRAKKVGFFSGRKRESIFKSPDDPFGKVGVTGSGKGLTEFQKREKHLHLKGANMESVDD
ncbi:Survival of motor neuron-related-splicing factor 30 [Sesamum angolense]|uniref:Survival of motor neuron-related-splicing factor 30 n=1 Tax=Sesamum angolense TaxID=2727404 RepID=A0AAE2C2N1_9LAMI|nr:Survival of motor neuron-related-splicing factor 30 [Sesamum angolense]